jgi:hypothetical protein
MNDRQRFLATMRYQPRDRAPICDFGFWDETLDIWHQQGLPPHVSDMETDAYFGMDRLRLFKGDPDHIYRTGTTGATALLCPMFDERVIEDRGDQEVFLQDNGVVVLRQKRMRSIPLPLSHTLVDRDSWETYYRPRLDPDHPARYPSDWTDRVKVWTNPERGAVAILPGGGLYGPLRNWMGLEQLSFALYDDPALFEEMVTTIADCIVGTLTKLLESGGHFDACSIWEDMAYNSGPLISPKHFRQYLSPHYRRITDLLHRYGVDIVLVDSDGKIDDLIPLWLDAGVNCVYPVEIGTWNADPVRFRKQYGRNLLMMGGFDKRILARSREAIRSEIYRLASLVEDGGYIGFCDHRVPPDVPFDNYIYYLSCVREVWGKNRNLQPMQ